MLKHRIPRILTWLDDSRTQKIGYTYREMDMFYVAIDFRVEHTQFLHLNPNIYNNEHDNDSLINLFWFLSIFSPLMRFKSTTLNN